MVNIISGTKKDFDGLAKMFDDPTWSRENMQNYFRKLEKNLYSNPSLSPEHGFDGWLKTSTVPIDVLLRNPALIGMLKPA
jgi:choline dehydrogenase